MSSKHYLSNLFGLSPVRPLQEHITKVHVCVQELRPLFRAVVENDQDEVVRIQERIAGLEHDADDLKKALRYNLPKGLWMPVDRRDVLEVLLMQDKIANQAKDIAGLVRGRRMTLPQSMHALFVEYVDRSIETSERALAVINELDELLETGFRGPEVARVQSMLADLNAAESKTDRIQIELRAILFGLENSLRPTDVMFTYQLIEGVGQVADFAQRVGSRLQLVLAR